MSSAIEAPPNVYGFGLQFNYSNWTAGTVLTLVNVPWNNDYRDIVRFPTSDDLDKWIEDQPNFTVRKVSLGKFNQNVKIEAPINATMRYNYLRAENPLMPVEGDVERNYYYFITNVNFINPSTTELTLQLDVWQTFGYDVTFGSAFVERGHIGIANTNAFNNFGRDYLAEPEGFDVGGEYRVVHAAGRSITKPDADGGYSVLVCSTIDMTVDPGEYGTSDNPSVVASRGTILQNIPTGASFYVFKTGADFLKWLEQMQDRSWISQGIVSVTIIPNPERYYQGFVWEDVSPVGVQAFYKAPKDYPDTVRTNISPDWRNLSFISNILGSRYKGLKKFLTYPYMVIEITTWTGSPIIVKPEMWQNPDAAVSEMCALVPPGQRIAIMPWRYNYDAETDYTTHPDPAVSSSDDFGEFLDMATVISNFPQIPIVNDMGISYLASNRNALNFEFRSADWSQQRTMNAANTGFNQASAGMNLQNSLTGISVGAANQLTDIQTNAAIGHGIVGGVSSIAGGAVGGAAGGPAGMALGAASGAVSAGATAFDTAISVNAMQMGNQTRNAAANAANAARVGTSGYVRDTNYDLASVSAKGDYANTIAGIQAKIQDARMTQPSTSGQFGGDAFNLVYGYTGFSVRWKMPNIHALRAVGDYWLRYGYSVRQYVSIPSNLMCMTKFTYWKLSETYISQGPFPEAFKQILRGIFEKGVTVWSDPDFIGRTDFGDNQPLTGISY